MAPLFPPYFIRGQVGYKWERSGEKARYKWGTGTAPGAGRKFSID